jgi:ABC-type lipoprotein release transport system permease subunit
MNALRFAWRNLWRNRRRTLITLAAVSLTSAILIASYTLTDGIMAHTLASATNLVMGEVQIHHPGYLSDRSMYAIVDQPHRILAGLADKGVPAAARSYGYGLAARETKSAGAQFWGVDPAREKAVFELADHLAEGRFLADEAEKGVVLGRKLAKSLGAGIGTEIVVVIQAADGSMGEDLFTVTGILKAAGEGLDRNAALMHRDDFETLFVSEGRVHEIALNTRNKLPLTETARIAGETAPDESVETWRELAPMLSDMIAMSDSFSWLFGVFFFLAGGLGVMNTMLMATFERIREFGVLKALGATPFRIMRDVAAEALVLAVVSAIIGLAIGLPAAYYLQEVGLDLTAFAGGSPSFAGVAFDPVWRAVVSANAVLWPVGIMCVVCLLASLYPAALAARLDPVKAMTKV